jgi:hypothetical protein
MTMPLQKPGRSKQDYETPPELLDALAETRFGRMEFDLAATPENTKAPRWYGPGLSSEGSNSFLADWEQTGCFNLWLNPPFGHIEPWAKKCAETKCSTTRIFFLTPASVGARWFEKHVFGKARVLFLGKRLTFVGEKDPYPKDCMISVFGEKPGFAFWDWTKPHFYRTLSTDDWMMAK